MPHRVLIEKASERALEAAKEARSFGGRRGSITFASRGGRNRRWFAGKALSKVNCFLGVCVLLPAWPEQLYAIRQPDEVAAFRARLAHLEAPVAGTPVKAGRPTGAAIGREWERRQ